MRVTHLNTLASEMLAALKARPGLNATPDKPFTRTSALSPCQYNAILRLPVPEGELLVMISMPGAVVDQVCGLSGNDGGARPASLANLARGIGQRVTDRLVGGEGTAPPRPQVLIGADVHVPELATGHRRICVPWQTAVGAFSIEATLLSAERAPRAA